MLKKIKEDIKEYYAVVIGIVLYIVLFQFLFNDVCIFKILLGIECPGCGLTHATMYLFTGRFKEAFDANWTVFLWWIFILLFFFDRYIKRIKIKPVPYILTVVGIITIIRYIIYMFFV